jgi:uncharacterized protein YijF (DUF1287 family)
VVTRPVDLAADLRSLTANLDSRRVPDLATVLAVHDAACRADDERWITWACRAFDAAHERAGCCA